MAGGMLQSRMRPVIDRFRDNRRHDEFQYISGSRGNRTDRRKTFASVLPLRSFATSPVPL